jgi:hypothetical protein
MVSCSTLSMIIFDHNRFELTSWFRTFVFGFTWWWWWWLSHRLLGLPFIIKRHLFVRHFRVSFYYVRRLSWILELIGASVTVSHLTQNLAGVCARWKATKENYQKGAEMGGGDVAKCVRVFVVDVHLTLDSQTLTKFSLSLLSLTSCV